MLKKLKKFKKEHKETIDEAKDVTKELTTTYTSNVPEYLHKNRNKICDIIVQYRKGEISSESIKPILRTAFMLLNCVTKEEQEEILRTCLKVDLDIKKDSDFTNEEYEIYKEIISYIHSNRQKEIKILLKKAAQKLNNQELSISKETIDFIISITDEKLETLKKIFRYVVHIGILKYKDIAQDFIKMGFCQRHTDNIKFLGRIFVNQDAVGGKAYNIKAEAITTAEGIHIWKNLIEKIPHFKINEPFNLKILPFPFAITKMPTHAGIIDISIQYFVILTEVGLETYSLLKDEIEDYPIDYLKNFANREEYKNFGFEIINVDN